MSISVPEFWKLVIDSRLLTNEQCQALSQEFNQMKGGGASNAAALCEWLISRNALTPYQTQVLQAGHTGPFFYGDYKVYDRIADGRLAGMFRAVHSPTNHLVILQFVTGPAITDAALWRKIAANAQRAAQVKHRHLQRVFEPVDLTAYKFAAMQDIRGVSVERQLQQSPLPAAQACRIVRDAAIGLEAMHQSNQFHGDIRPHQLWTDDNGNVRLLRDPFAAPASLYAADGASPDELLKRADYCAPEFAQQGKQPDVLTDIYALGCTLYHLLSGSPPFAGGDITAKLQRHASEAIKPLDTMGVPREIGQVVAYAMAKNPAVRYQQANVLAEQLAGFVSPEKRSTPAPPALSTLPAYENWVRQKQSSLASQAAPPTSAPAAAAPAVAAAASGAAGVPMINTDNPLKSRGSASPRKPIVPKDGEDEYFNTRNRNRLIIGLSIAGVLALGLIFLLAYMGGGGGPEEDVAEADAVETVDADPADGDDVPDIIIPKGEIPVAGGDGNETTDGAEVDANPGGNPFGRQIVVADDNQLLWASPTSGPAIELSYVPPDAQTYIAVRPAELLRNEKGAAVLQALGPTFQQEQDKWETAAGTKLPEIEQMVIALHDNGGAMPRPSFVVRLKGNSSIAELLGRWGNPAPQAVDESKIFNANGWTFWAPESENGSLFLMGSTSDVRAAVKFGGAPPPMRRELKQLVDTSDANRHLTVLFNPNYFFSDGRMLFSGAREKVLRPLSWFLGDGVQAGTLSMHISDHFYVEARVAGELGKDRIQMATELRERLDQIPTDIEEYLVTMNPHPYWKKIAFRYPRMIQFLHSQSRVGADDDQAVINSVMPLEAAPNLFIGTELVIAQAPGGAPVVVGETPTVPQNIEQLLAHKTTLSFDQKSLEFAMADIATDLKEELPQLPFELQVKIIGADLEKDGLTRNQQVRDINVRDAPISDILTAIVVKAMSTGKPPNDPSQKMVWVVGPESDNPNEKVILITTRAAAAANGYTLPDVFK